MLDSRALFRYGSTLSPLLRRPDSVPDSFALVDDLAEALRQLGRPGLAAVAERLIPPITILHQGGKLSLITPSQATRELASRRDLYLAGRLSKKLELMHGRIDDLVETSIAMVVELSALELPRRVSLEECVLACLGLSYRGEIRPEGPEKVRRLYDAFADFYFRRFAPRIEAHARSRGIGAQNGVLRDDRDAAVRAREVRTLRRILGRSRRRSMLRWPQQLLIFDGSLGYVMGKLRRSWT